MISLLSVGGGGTKLNEVWNRTVLLELPHPAPPDHDHHQHDDDQGEGGQADGEDVDPGGGAHLGEGERGDVGVLER